MDKINKISFVLYNDKIFTLKSTHSKALIFINNSGLAFPSSLFFFITINFKTLLIHLSLAH